MPKRDRKYPDKRKCMSCGDAHHKRTLVMCSDKKLRCEECAGNYENLAYMNESMDDSFTVEV